MTEAPELTTAAAKAATRQKVARLAFWSSGVAGVVLALKLSAGSSTGSVALSAEAVGQSDDPSAYQNRPRAVTPGYYLPR